MIIDRRAQLVEFPSSITPAGVAGRTGKDRWDLDSLALIQVVTRNTQAPLLATNIVDFWCRCYFYFKELLMDFFFFPTFLRIPRLPVLWRTLASTAAAAFLSTENLNPH